MEESRKETPVYDAPMRYLIGVVMVIAATAAVAVSLLGSSILDSDRRAAERHL